MAESLSIVDIVNSQDDIWYIVPQFVGFCIFLVAGFAETARAPFDLPEADAELVAGYNTEYGGMRFGAFFMAEYMHIIVISPASPPPASSAAGTARDPPRSARSGCS